MKRRARMFQVVVSISLLLALVFSPQLATPARANPDTIIDSFETTQTLTQSGLGTASSSITAGSGILGGERDLITTITVVGAGTDQTAAANGGGLHRLSHSAQAGVMGYTEVQWDGSTDAGATTIDPNGLGSIDLTAGGDNYFIVELVGADLDTNLTITFWDFTANSASTCSTFSTPLPVMNSNSVPRIIAIPYTSFGTSGTCTTAANIADVGAISLIIDGTVVESADVTLDFIRTGQLDFGDHSGAAYYTQMFNLGGGEVWGAGHNVGSLYLGASVDGELDGQPTANSDGDDVAGIDDEDGVVPTPLVTWAKGSATGGSVDITVTGGNGCLYAWIDWNRDGAFGNALTTAGTIVAANERVLNGLVVTPGTNTYTFPTPSNIVWDSSALKARFRLYPRDPGGSCSTIVSGTPYLKFPDRYLATGGEVEDYRWGFTPNAVTVSSLSAKTEIANTAGLVLLAVTVLSLGAFSLVLRRRKATDR